MVARLIKQSESCQELIRVKTMFLDDLITLCENNEDNRRYENRSLNRVPVCDVCPHSYHLQVMNGNSVLQCFISKIEMPFLF